MRTIFHAQGTVVALQSWMDQTVAPDEQEGGRLAAMEQVRLFLPSG
jgi:hypothetical protein